MGGGGVGSWALGIRPEMVARHRWRRCLGGQPSGHGDGGQAVDQSVGLLPRVTGWVLSTIHHKPLVAPPDALLLGEPESWLAKGVMASPGSTLLRLTSSGPWTEPLCSCLTHMGTGPPEGRSGGSASAPDVSVPSTPVGSKYWGRGLGLRATLSSS